MWVHADTSNQLHTEMAASGDDDQYQYITFDQPLSPPSLDFMTSLSSIAPGNGPSDFLDALTVAADSLFRILEDRPELQKAGVTKRIILISDFATPAKDDPEDEFVPTLMGKLAEKDVVLEVNCLDAAHQVCLVINLFGFQSTLHLHKSHVRPLLGTAGDCFGFVSNVVTQFCKADPRLDPAYSLRHTSQSWLPVKTNTPQENPHNQHCCCSLLSCAGPVNATSLWISSKENAMAVWDVYSSTELYFC